MQYFVHQHDMIQKKYINDPISVFKNNINSIIKFLRVLENKNIRKNFIN